VSSRSPFHFRSRTTSSFCNIRTARAARLSCGAINLKGSQQLASIVLPVLLMTSDAAGVEVH
jgi:hypothetical protein